MTGTGLAKGIPCYITGETGRHTGSGKLVSLSNVPLHTKTVLYGMNLNGLVGQKLLDLGFTPNTQLELIRKGPYDNLIAVKVRGAVIALRKSEAEAMFVEMDDSPLVSHLARAVSRPAF
jgi:ferrous iron transport protein A